MDQHGFCDPARTYARMHARYKIKISFLIEIKFDLCKFINQIQKMDTHFMTLKYFLKKKIILENFFETLFLIQSGEWEIRILIHFI